MIAGVGACMLTAIFYFLPGMRDTETPGHTSRVILSEPTETAALRSRTPMAHLQAPGPVSSLVRARRQRSLGRSPGAFRIQGGEMAQVESKPRATSSTEDRKEVLKRIKDEGVEFLLLWFTDLEGT